MWLGLRRFFQLLVCGAQKGFCVVFSTEKFRYVLSESRIVADLSDFADFGRELGSLSVQPTYVYLVVSAGAVIGNVHCQNQDSQD